MKHFKTIDGKKIPFPVFFPDATRAVLRTLDQNDLRATKTPGVLVNTFHLKNELGEKIFKKFKGVNPTLYREEKRKFSNKLTQLPDK